MEENEKKLEVGWGGEMKIKGGREREVKSGWR